MRKRFLLRRHASSTLLSVLIVLAEKRATLTDDSFVVVLFPQNYVCSCAIRPWHVCASHTAYVTYRYRLRERVVCLMHRTTNCVVRFSNETLEVWGFRGLLGWNSNQLYNTVYNTTYNNRWEPVSQVYRSIDVVPAIQQSAGGLTRPYWLATYNSWDPQGRVVCIIYYIYMYRVYVHLPGRKILVLAVWEYDLGCGSSRICVQNNNGRYTTILW